MRDCEQEPREKEEFVPEIDGEDGVDETSDSLGERDPEHDEDERGDRRHAREDPRDGAGHVPHREHQYRLEESHTRETRPGEISDSGDSRPVRRYHA